MLKTLNEKYLASMVLHAVGDAMGYKNGSWEFKFSGVDIHEELGELGGISKLKLNPINWRVSDDTILHLAVAECLHDTRHQAPSEPVWFNLIDHYKKGMSDMKDRAPGNTTRESVHQLSKHTEKGYQIPFNPRGGGCGASMRSSCIGLRYPRPEQKQDLVAFAVESSRMTHHHPIGYLGGLAAALFVSYAIQEVPIKSWGAKFLEDLPLAQDYIRSTNYCVKQNFDCWDQVVVPWKYYLRVRGIEDGLSEPVFPAKYTVAERDTFYKTICNSQWAGANGIDSVLIAYDGLLGCKGDWTELCLRAMLHGGDNDSTGCIAGSLYGALYGFSNVPENNYKEIEYSNRLNTAGQNLYDIEHK